MPEIPPQDDPVVSRPMSVLILVSVFLLLVTVAWSLYVEFFGLRPWRDYQDRSSAICIRPTCANRSISEKARNKLSTRHPTTKSSKQR